MSSDTSRHSLAALDAESSKAKGKMEGVYGKGVSKNCFYEVSTSKIPSRKLCEGFCFFFTVSFRKGPPFHEWSANEARSTNVLGLLRSY